jgi:hypothetical protein
VIPDCATSKGVILDDFMVFTVGTSRETGGDRVNN